jgi:hypothetical protein
VANAPVPVPRTFGVSEFEATAYLNSVRDALNFLLNVPIAQLIQNTTQSIANSTVTPLAFDGSVVDSYGGHSNTTNNTRYVAQVAGWYNLSGPAAFAANTTGVRVARLRNTGTDVVYFDAWAQTVAAASTPSAVCAEGILFLNVGNYAELGGYQTSGGALSTIVAGPQSGMSVTWLHA